MSVPFLYESTVNRIILLERERKYARTDLEFQNAIHKKYRTPEHYSILAFFLVDPCVPLPPVACPYGPPPLKLAKLAVLAGLDWVGAKGTPACPCPP